MSKIGKNPIKIPEGTEVKIGDKTLEVRGKGGNLSLPILEFVRPEIKDKEIQVSALASHKQARANWGTFASLIKNAVHGVTQGFEKKLIIEGIGFKANMEGDTLVLNIGFTHSVKFKSPEGIKISVEKSSIKISGIDKNLVGQTAAQIRKLKKPEPYKGKGIRYENEVIRRKAGKKVAGAETSAK